MITVKLDPTGSHYVRWPETASEVITLARRFLARENALSVELRLKDVPLAVQALLTQVEVAVSSAVTGETDRAVASELFRQRMAEAKPLVALLMLRLKVEYANNLAQLEGWGLATVQGTRGINVRRPIKVSEIVTFLRAYVAKETSLPVEQRITNPSLATVQTLLTGLETALTNRIVGQEQRELGVEQRRELRSELLHWLQIGALQLVMRNGGAVSTALQLHGFTVVERGSTSSSSAHNGSGGDGQPSAPPQPPS